MSSEVTLADLFDAQGQLRSIHELPAAVAAQIASFDVKRITVRKKGDATITRRKSFVCSCETGGRPRSRDALSVGRSSCALRADLGHIPSNVS